MATPNVTPGFTASAQMRRLKVRIEMDKITPHLYQILAGFRMLEKQSLLDTSYALQRPPRTRHSFLTVVLNDSVRILYDLEDGYVDRHNNMHLLDELLADHDICFKRSYRSGLNALLEQGDKIHPLGLNYLVTAPGNFAHLPNRLDSRKDQLKKLVRLLPIGPHSNRHILSDRFELPPAPVANESILFLTRVFPPSTHDRYDELNASRVSCIRACREHFGNRFYGGLVANDLARREYPDLVVRDPAVTQRRRYLTRMHASMICVATIGLYGSNGWKLSEYVAASKPIVSEHLYYDVPGGFSDGVNYLGFSGVEDCLEKIDLLLTNPQARHRMQNKNYQYYHRYVRPDRLVLNSLLEAIELL
jgi:hypothetical protein